jgi:biofilm PGA synthesis protein PgaD
LVYKDHDYADYFHVELAQLEKCVHSQLVSVYHNEQGHITRLENDIT